MRTTEEVTHWPNLMFKTVYDIAFPVVTHVLHPTKFGFSPQTI